MVSGSDDLLFKLHCIALQTPWTVWMYWCQGMKNSSFLLHTAGLGCIPSIGGVKTYTEKLPYEYRCYLISFFKNGLSFKTFFKAEKHSKKLCSVVSFIGIFCYLSPRQSCSLVIHRRIRCTFVFIYLLWINLSVLVLIWSCHLALFCHAIRLLTKYELSFFLLGSHESFSPALNTWPGFKDKVLHQITVAFLFQISFTSVCSQRSSWMEIYDIYVLF